MKIKTADLVGPTLDWAVTAAEGFKPVMRHDYMKAKAAANNYKGDLAWHLEVTPNEPITVDETGVTHALRSYSEQWSQGGMLIEREKLELRCNDDGWQAFCFGFPVVKAHSGRRVWAAGPTPLIAAMRCFVAATLGDEVEIPDELMKQP